MLIKYITINNSIFSNSDKNIDNWNDGDDDITYSFGIVIALWRY